MNQDNNWINDFVTGQLATVKFETNWFDGYITCSTRRNEAIIYQPNGYHNLSADYNRVIDKDQKIRDLEARVKELEAILEEEI